MTPSRAARLLLLLLAVALTTLALGAPRFTWANDGVVVDHPRTHAVAALGAALALAAAAYGARPRVLVALAGLGAAALVSLGATQLAWRVEALATGFEQRSLGRAVRLSWSDIEAVEAPRRQRHPVGPRRHAGRDRHHAASPPTSASASSAPSPAA